MQPQAPQTPGAQNEDDFHRPGAFEFGIIGGAVAAGALFATFPALLVAGEVGFLGAGVIGACMVSGVIASKMAVKVAREAVIGVQNRIHARGLDAQTELDRMPLMAAVAKSTIDANGKHVYFVRNEGERDFREVDAREHRRFCADAKKSDFPLVTMDVRSETIDMVTSVRGRTQSVLGADGASFPAILRLTASARGFLVKTAAWFESGQMVSPPKEPTIAAAPVLA